MKRLRAKEFEMDNQNMYGRKSEAEIFLEGINPKDLISYDVREYVETYSYVKKRAVVVYIEEDGTPPPKDVKLEGLVKNNL